MPADRTALEPLLARLEGATGRDHAIDAELYRLFVHEPDVAAGIPCGEFSQLNPMMFPNYTDSLDGAVALAARALPGWDWVVDSGCHAAVAPEDAADGRAAAGHAPAPALALCVAVVKAKLA